MTHSMLCASVGHLLEAWHDGELEIDEQIAVDAHLAVCAACSATMRELRDLRTQLRRDPVLEEPRETDPFASQRLDAELGAMAEAIVTGCERNVTTG